MKKKAAHIDNYRKYIKVPKLNRTPCEQVLGSDAIVDGFAQFFELNAESLNIIGAYLLHDYIENNAINTEQFEAYKKAIGAFGGFFVSCAEEKAIRKNIAGIE